MALPDNLFKGLKDYQDELRSICIVSAVECKGEGELEEGYESKEYPGLVIKIMPSPFHKCERCWIHDSSVGHDKEHPALCNRCAQVIAN